jgi:acyl carrier protein
MEQMTVEQYMAAVRPKVQGSWNLHEQLLDHDLDFFVMLSSLSGIVGLPSQCNYAAGGSYEDALAKYRILKGLPAAVVDIGVVQAVGVVAENQDLAEGLRRLGYKPLIEDNVLTSIEAIVADPPKSQVLIGLDGADWESSGLIRDLRFTPLKVRDSAQSNGGGTGSGPAGELISLLASASSMEAAVAAVTASISKKLVDIFLMAEEDVDPSKPPTTYGVDSLSAVELRNMLSLKAGAEVSIFKIMQSASITDLAASVVASSSFVDPGLLTK